MNTIADTLRLAAAALAHHSESPRLDAQILLGKVLGMARPALIARGSARIASDALRGLSGTDRAAAERRADRLFDGYAGILVIGSQGDARGARAAPRNRNTGRAGTCSSCRRTSRDRFSISAPGAARSLSPSPPNVLGRASPGPTSPRLRLPWRRRIRSLSALPQIAWRLGSWFEAVPGERFDLIVANPPYVAAGDRALEALSAEPALALRSGPTGLESLRAIIEAAASHLEPSGRLLLEHGSMQGSEVALLFERNGFRGIRSHDDYSGLPRVTQGTIHSPH